MSLWRGPALPLAAFDRLATLKLPDPRRGTTLNPSRTTNRYRNAPAKHRAFIPDDRFSYITHSAREVQAAESLELSASIAGSGLRAKIL